MMDASRPDAHNLKIYMSSKLYLLIALCLLTIWSEAAHAKVRVGVEPYLGYSRFTYTADSIQDERLGAILGGKGGVYVSDKMWIALDYHLGGPYNLENNKNEYLNRMWGIGVGLSSPGKARAWFGYYYDAVIDDIERNYLLQGTAFKISVGMEFQSKLSINLEYCVQNYTKVRSASYEIPTALGVSVLFLSLSSPIYLN